MKMKRPQRIPPMKVLNAAFLARMSRTSPGLRVVQATDREGKWHTLSTHDDFPEAFSEMTRLIGLDNTRSYRVRRKEDADKN